MRLFHFYKEIDSGMRSYFHCQWKIGYSFEMKRRIIIRRHSFVGKLYNNNVAKFQDKLVQGLPTWSSKCMHNLHKFSYGETRKNRISNAMR